MISQFFVLSQRGDSIVFCDYRGEVQKGSTEIFFEKVEFWKEDGQEEAQAPLAIVIDASCLPNYLVKYLQMNSLQMDEMREANQFLRCSLVRQRRLHRPFDPHRRSSDQIFLVSIENITWCCFSESTGYASGKNALHSDTGKARNR
ncbi:hypothetical protein MLD38_034817 [Melastoma candidum]|uniref:Uncharacterized protein n=1 Tax=Melastoma candidum TaxID=119954 RepID=A0ACB9MEJ9_9MYRT|nr:hypothetical protein MLD38_034817 [Melastoma candidum]